MANLDSYEYKGFTFQHFNYKWYALKENKIYDCDQYRNDLQNRIDDIIKKEDNKENV